MKRKYLLIQHLKFPVPEHAMIESRIRENSAGDCKLIFTTANRGEGGVVMYLFTSDLQFSQMSFGPLMNEDRMLVVEVTGRHRQEGMNVAQQWLQARREKSA